jgi:hypothetical protein
MYNTGFGQTKFEQEFRIKPRDVPGSALAFIDSIQFDRKIKWYKEIGHHGKSIEAKTRFKGKKYSVEFSAEGVFEDVEIEINWTEMPLETRNDIEKYLHSEYGKYSIDKIQMQYSGTKVSVLDLIKELDILTKPVIRYEIVLSTKIDKTYRMFEFLFSESGDFILKQEIVVRNTDNIEY